jgi:hypothetical protein
LGSAGRNYIKIGPTLPLANSKSSIHLSCELCDEPRASVQQDYSRGAMVLLDLLVVQSDCCFCIESCVSQDEVPSLGDTVNYYHDTVNDYHDPVAAMSWRKLDNEVDTDNIPSIFWSL